MEDDEKEEEEKCARKPSNDCHWHTAKCAHSEDVGDGEHHVISIEKKKKNCCSLLSRAQYANDFSYWLARVLLHNR